MQHSPLDWEFRTVQSDRYCLAMDGVCSWPRGKVLGGSSVRCNKKYFEQNIQNWKYDFKTLKNFAYV